MGVASAPTRSCADPPSRSNRVPSCYRASERIAATGAPAAFERDPGSRAGAGLPGVRSPDRGDPNFCRPRASRAARRCVQIVTASTQRARGSRGFRPVRTAPPFHHLSRDQRRGSGRSVSAAPSANPAPLRPGRVNAKNPGYSRVPYPALRGSAASIVWSSMNAGHSSPSIVGRLSWCGSVCSPPPAAGAPPP
jgi:hypothetical protein